MEDSCALFFTIVIFLAPSPQIIALEVVREVVGNVGNCFRAQNHLQWQITNRQKLLTLSSLDEGFN